VKLKKDQSHTHTHSLSLSLSLSALGSTPFRCRSSRKLQCGYCLLPMAEGQRPPELDRSRLFRPGISRAHWTRSCYQRPRRLPVRFRIVRGARGDKRTVFPAPMNAALCLAYTSRLYKKIRDPPLALVGRPTSGSPVAIRSRSREDLRAREVRKRGDQLLGSDGVISIHRAAKRFRQDKTSGASSLPRGRKPDWTTSANNPLGCCARKRTRCVCLSLSENRLSF